MAQDISAWKPVEEASAWKPVPEPAGAAPPDTGAQMRNSAVAKVGASMPTPAPETHRLRDFGSNFVDAVNPLPTLKRLASDPMGVVKDAAGAQIDQFRQAGNDLTNTREMPRLGDRLSSAYGHGMAGLLPLIGPAAAQAGEQIGSGDTAGGMGRAAGLIAPIVAGPAVAKGVGKAIEAPAGPIAETALGVRKLDRAYGKTPGKAVLEETTGVRPGTIENSARARLKTLNSDLENTVAGSNNPASLRPGIDVVNNAEAKAVGRNAKTTVDQLSPMRAHLTKDNFSGAAIPTVTTPSKLLALKRGFGDEFIHNWNPDTMKDVRGTAAKTYHALKNELETAAPGSGPINERISSLIPVAERARSTDLNAGAPQKILGRIARPTGALIGAAEGFRHGGPIGGLIGLGLPEVISSPTTQMIAARTLHAAGKGLESPAGGRAGQIIPLLKGRKRQEEEAPQR